MSRIKIAPQWQNRSAAWAYAVRSLQHLHSDQGVLLDDFLEKKFVWEKGKGDPPYREPWVGFLHNPPNVPAWFDARGGTGEIISTGLWRESLPYCRGLFTLSKHLANWLRPRVEVPISSLFHPAAPCRLQFSMDSYYKNENLMVVHVGWWLRKFHSFYLLRTRALQKLLLLPISQLHLSAIRPKVKALLLTERGIARQKSSGGTGMQPFRIAYYKDDQEYDYLLSRNIVFIDLYDSSANNVIIECIVRNTPLAVNRHPAVIEYLGEGYPLYFDTVEEASRLIENGQRVEAAHNYLRDQNKIKERLTIANFIQEFTDSPIYRRLAI